MSIPKKKYYVVWIGDYTGIHDSWEEAEALITGTPNARCKSFPTYEAAQRALRGDDEEQLNILRNIFTHAPAAAINYEAIPEIRRDALAVDGACAKNPGPMEYRCVRVSTGEEVFHMGPLADGTNNIGEYLALVHALALLDKQGDHLTPIYSDSRTALAWLRRRGHKSTLKPTASNARIFELLARADAWVQSHQILNPVLKWDTEKWGEIPADFGRK